MSFAKRAVTFTAWFYDQIEVDIARLPPNFRLAAQRWREAIES